MEEGGRRVSQRRGCGDGNRGWSDQSAALKVEEC